MPHIAAPASAFNISEEQCRTVLKLVKTNKAAGPDGIAPLVLKNCANELAPVLTSLFNLSLESCRVPNLWKHSIIVPVPKKPKPLVSNDFRPVALTSTIMKCFEHLVLGELLAATANQLDPMQFAYKKHRGVEDATALLFHRIVEHLEGTGNYARVLFVDFSSAFNTMTPSKLYLKLTELRVDPALCTWILSYLRGRTQQVRVGGTLSDTVTTNIGAPQGCVLSPVLFTIYTDKHRGEEPHTFVDKYADDAAIVGLVSNKDESHYRNTVSDFVAVCHSDDLEVNVTKTKEMIVDFRRNQEPHKPVEINGNDVIIVSQYDYLGTTLCDNLCWSANMERLAGKASKRMFHLRKLREFKVCQRLLELFYSSVVETVLTFGITVWGGSLAQHDKKTIKRVRKRACRIVGAPLQQWDATYRAKTTSLAHKIRSDPRHPLHKEFQDLPSGRRLRQPLARTKRYKNSFVPRVISLLNTTTDSVC